MSAPQLILAPVGVWVPPGTRRESLGVEWDAVYVQRWFRLLLGLLMDEHAGRPYRTVVAVQTLSSATRPAFLDARVVCRDFDMAAMDALDDVVDEEDVRALLLGKLALSTRSRAR